MNARRRAAWVLALVAQLGVAGEAGANGAFPSSGQILFDPADPQRIGARSTYGLVATMDGGASWRWTCEAALEYGGDFHPQLAITGDGAVYGGLLDGMIRGSLGGCAWSRVASLQGMRVVDVSQDRSGRSIAALIPPGDGARGEVWTSTDGAATWSRLGAPLPVKFQPLTLDTAPGGRVYVSGLVEGTPIRGGLAWSDDEGASWGLSTVLDADQSKAPYIGAIDPLDPDVVWVRLDAAPGQLVVTRDGGASWETALVLDGFLRAFALSPDGSEVIAGGELDGLVRAGASALDFEPMAPVAARCAQWREDAIDVCGTEALDGFTLARSTDDGATFAPLYVQACLGGPHDCAPETPVGQCAGAWPTVRDQLGGSCGEGGSASSATTGSGSGSGAGGAAPSGPGPTGTGPGDAAAGPGAAGGAGPDAGQDAGGGCGCRAAPATRGEAMAGGAVCALLAGALARRTRQRTRRRADARRDEGGGRH